MKTRYVDATDLTETQTVLDLAATLATRLDGVKRLVSVLAPDATDLTGYVNVVDALNLLQRSKFAPQWKGLAKRHVAQVLKVQTRSAVLYTFILSEDNAK